jgi:PAS domain S-box-containing protein
MSNHVHYKTYINEFGIVTLLVGMLSLVWLAYMRVDDYQLTRYVQAQNAVTQLVEELKNTLEDKRRLVDLITILHTRVFENIIDDPGSSALTNELSDLLNAYFPHNLGFSLSDDSGEAITSSFISPLSQSCLTSTLQTTLDSRWRIHHHPELSHFDISVPWQSSQFEGFFVVSFPSAYIGELLKQHGGEDYYLIILNQDHPKQIEVWPPDIPKRKTSDFLTPEITKNQGYSFPIPGTRWQLTAVYHPESFHRYRQTVIDQTLLLVTTFTAVLLVMLLVSRRVEHKTIEAEEALRASQQRYRAIVQDQTELICRYLPDTTLTFVNDAYCRYFEKSQEDLLGHSFLHLYPEEDWELIRMYIQALLDQPGTSSYEYQTLDNKGNPVWQSWVTRSITNGFGGVVEIQAVGTDITQRRRAEEALRDSEARYRSVITALEEAVVLQNPDGRVITCNPSVERVLGIAAQTLENSYIPWQQLKPLRGNGERFPASQHPARLAMESGRPCTGVVMGITKADGVQSWLSVNANPLVYYERTMPYAVVTSFTDITERTRAQAALREREARLNAIFNNAAVGIGLTNMDGRFIQVNARLAEMLVCSVNDLLALNDTDMLGGDDQSIALEQRRRLINGDINGYQLEVRCQRHDGEVFWADLYGAKITSQDGHFQALLNIVVDLTSRKEAEEALRYAKDEAEAATRAKSEFLANMSHELRTPMNGVVGMTELLLKTSLNDQQSEFARTIRRSANNLLMLLNDILDFSKIEAGKLLLEPHPFDLEGVALEVARLLLHQARDKGVEIWVKYPPDAPRYLIGDAGRIQQIMTNLLGNAVKFTMQGYVLIDITVLEMDTHKAHMQIRVKDTGVGIPDDKLAAIFDKFTQADSSTTRRFGGTGLGLTITKQLIDMMDGTIEVDSTLHQGSEFKLKIPLALAQAHEADKFHHEKLAQGRVLMAMHTPLAEQILHEQLSALGVDAQVIEAKGHLVRDCLHQAYQAGQPFWLFISNVSMDIDSMPLPLAIRKQAIPLPCFAWYTPSLTPHEAELLRIQGYCGALPSLTGLNALKHYLGDLHEAYHTNKKPPRWAEMGTPTEDEFEQVDEAPPQQQMSAATSGRRWQILLAEDSEVNSMVAVNMLSQMQCDVDLALNGEEAVDALKQKDYDAIFMDIQMPIMDGLQATRQIRKLPPPKNSVRVIAVTANAMRGDKEMCLAAGMDDYIAKPFSFNQLQCAVSRHCEAGAAGAAGAATDTAANASVQASASPLSQATADATAASATPVSDATQATAPVSSAENTTAHTEEDEAALPIFDAEQLRNITMGNAKLLNRIRLVFLEDTTEQLANLPNYLARTDQATLQRTLHSIKGESRNVGALRFGDVAFQGETAAKAEDYAAIESLLPQLQTEFQNLQAAWEATDWENFS